MEYTMHMVAGVHYDLGMVFKRGATLETAVPQNLNNYKLHMYVKNAHGNRKILLKPSAANGMLNVIDPAAGRFSFNLRDDQTADLAGVEGVFRITAESIADPSKTYLLLQGPFKVVA